MAEERTAGEELRARAAKLARWRARDVDPYGGRYERTHSLAQVRAGAAELEGQAVAVAGRLVAVRRHGSMVFADLLDGSGRLQVCARRDTLPRFDWFLDLDLGDIIGVRGPVFRTRRGEITVEVRSFTLLSKALRPLPEKWHGLRDVDLRYRQRYLDLIANPEVRETFVLRSRMVAAVRRFLDERGFLEVETPMMHPLPGGAAARPFVTYHNALDMTLYLRIAPELYLKRLVIGGLERVYELGRVFRNEGISTRHNPEFTILEVYQAYADYTDMMRLTEELFHQVALAVRGTARLTFLGQEVDLTPPWPRVSLPQALAERAGVDVQELASDEAARAAARRLGVEVAETATAGQVLEALVDAFVQPHLIGPTFLTDHPVAISPLARRRPEQPHLAERFEVIIGGWEFANAFSELNDPEDQRRRFEAQARARQQGDEEAHVLDEDYLLALEHGLPPCGGLGVGMDRLAMLLAGVPSVRDVILFPLMRPRGPAV